MALAASVISSSHVSSQTHPLVFLCASLLCLGSTLLVSFCVRRLPLNFFVFFWFCCGFLCTSGASGGGTSGSAAGGISTVVDFSFCGVSTTVRRFSSDQLCSASRRTLRAYTTLSSVLSRCSSVRSLFTSHTADFHLSASFGAGFPDLFPTSGR